MRKTKIVIALVLLMCACKEKANVSLFKFVGTIAVPAQTEPFIARDHFKIDTSENAVVQIAYLGDDFKAWFLDGTEASKSETTLCCRKLRRSSFNTLIIAELGGETKAQTTLSELFYLLKKQPRLRTQPGLRTQPHGQEGILLTNGFSNIFYILDHKGILRTVDVYWFNDGWHVGTDSVWSNSHGWYDGRQVFSHNF